MYFETWSKWAMISNEVKCSWKFGTQSLWKQLWSLFFVKCSVNYCGSLYHWFFGKMQYLTDICVSAKCHIIQDGMMQRKNIIKTESKNHIKKYLLHHCQLFNMSASLPVTFVIPIKNIIALKIIINLYQDYAYF